SPCLAIRLAAGWRRRSPLDTRTGVSAMVLAATTPGRIGAIEGADDDQGPPPPAEVIDLMSRGPTTAIELAQIYAALAPHFLRAADPGPFRAALQPELLSPESMVRVFDALASW